MQHYFAFLLLNQQNVVALLIEDHTDAWYYVITAKDNLNTNEKEKTKMKTTNTIKNEKDVRTMRNTKKTNKITKTFSAVMAALIMMTSAASVMASADNTQEVVNMNTNNAICRAAETEPAFGDFFGKAPDVREVSKDLTGYVAEKVFEHFLGKGITMDLLNKATKYFFGWALSRNEKPEEQGPTLKDVISRMEGIEKMIDSYHKEEMARLKKLDSKIDSAAFRAQVDVISGDVKTVIDTIKINSDNITTTDSGVIDKTTYKTYKAILAEDACNISKLKKHLSDMEDFVMGNRYANDKKEGFSQFANYILDKINDRKVDYNFDNAPDFNEAVKGINGELQAMDAMTVLDCLCLMTLSNMQYKIRQYEIANGSYQVEENEKVFSSFENSAKSIAEYLKNIHEKYMETVKSVNVNTVVAEVTIGNVTKGFENIDEAWAAANNSKAKSFEIKIKKDITADAKTGFNLSKLDTKNGFNGQGGFKVAKGKTASVDLGGHRIFIDYSTKKDDKGSKMAVFELDGDLSMKNGTIEGGMNAVRVNGSSKVDLDNVKIFRTKGPSLYFLGKNEKLKMTNCTIKYAQNGTDHECCYGPDRDIFYGSAIHADVWGRGDYEIRNCLFEKNTGDMGGALSLPAYNGRVVIENCRFIGNRSRSAGSAIHGGAGIMTINGCLFRDNITATKIECKKNVVVNSRGSRGETHKETDCSYINNRQVDSIPVLDYKFEMERETSEQKGAVPTSQIEENIH